MNDEPARSDVGPASTDAWVVDVVAPLPSSRLQEVVSEASTRLGLPSDKLLALLENRIGPVTKGLPKASADRVASVLERAGVEVLVRLAGRGETPTVTRTPPPAQSVPPPADSPSVPPTSQPVASPAVRHPVQVDGVETGPTATITVDAGQASTREAAGSRPIVPVIGPVPSQDQPVPMHGTVGGTVDVADGAIHVDDDDGEGALDVEDDDPLVHRASDDAFDVDIDEDDDEDEDAFGTRGSWSTPRPALATAPRMRVGGAMEDEPLSVHAADDHVSDDGRRADGDRRAADGGFDSGGDTVDLPEAEDDEESLFAMNEEPMTFRDPFAEAAQRDKTMRRVLLASVVAIGLIVWGALRWYYTGSVL